MPDPVKTESATQPLLAPDNTGSAGMPAVYTPAYTRTRWLPQGTGIDQFFDRFVPDQYENGFAWRSRNIPGEEHRDIRFVNQPPQVQRIIAGNAEVLLEVYQETPVAELDRMREAGRQFLGLERLNIDEQFDFDLPQLRENMARRHHEKWYDNFKAMLESGQRTDANHRGFKPYDELPPIEVTILKVQTWANWRVLAALSDEDYALLRGIAARLQVG